MKEHLVVKHVWVLFKLAKALGCALGLMGWKKAVDLFALRDFATELSNYDSSRLRYKDGKMTFSSSEEAYS